MAALERYLRCAAQLPQQSLFQLELDQLRRLVAKYYALDAPLLRELAGRKLTSHVRKTLDDVAERLRLPLAVAERGFDNLRRVYKRVFEAAELGHAVLPVLRRQYLLSDALARRYLRAAYIRYHRWEVHKKKLAAVSYADLEFMARVHLQRWVRAAAHPFAVDPELQRALPKHRSLLVNDKAVLAAYATHVLAAVRPLLSHASAARIEAKFSSLVAKPILNLAAMLGDQKTRDFVLDLVTKIAVPFRKASIQTREAEALLAAMGQHSSSQEFARFVSGLSPCLMQIYELDQRR